MYNGHGWDDWIWIGSQASLSSQEISNIITKYKTKPADVMVVNSCSQWSDWEWTIGKSISYLANNYSTALLEPWTCSLLYGKDEEWITKIIWITWYGEPVFFKSE